MAYRFSEAEQARISDAASRSTGILYDAESGVYRQVSESGKNCVPVIKRYLIFSTQNLARADLMPKL